MRIVEANAERVFLREGVSSRVSQGLLLAAGGSVVGGFFLVFAVAFGPIWYGFASIGAWIVFRGVYGLAGSRRITAERWVNQLIIEHLIRFFVIPYSIKVNFGDVQEVQLQHLPKREAGSYSLRESFAVQLYTFDGDTIVIWTYDDRDEAVEISDAIAVVMDKPVLLTEG